MLYAKRSKIVLSAIHIFSIFVAEVIASILKLTNVSCGSADFLVELFLPEYTKYWYYDKS